MHKSQGFNLKIGFSLSLSLSLFSFIYLSSILSRLLERNIELLQSRTSGLPLQSSNIWGFHWGSHFISRTYEDFLNYVNPNHPLEYILITKIHYYITIYTYNNWYIHIQTINIITTILYVGVAIICWEMEQPNIIIIIMRKSWSYS